MSWKIHTLPIFVAMTAIVALLVAGCGESGQSTGPQGPSRSGSSPATTAHRSDGLEEHSTEHERAAGRSAAANRDQRQPERGDKAKSPPRNGGDGQETGQTIDTRLKKLLSGGGGEKTHVTSSPKEIRKIVHDLEADADQRGESTTSAVEKVLEGVLGGD